jgi:phosphatidylglycerophosphate synthase
MLTDQLRNLFSGITINVGKFLGKIGISANFVTFLVLVFGFIAAYLIYLGDFKLALIFVIASGIMDGFDGAVAKANHKETKFGALFDSVTDKITEISWYIALGFLNPEFWAPASMAIAFFMLSSYISKHAKSVGGKSGGGIMERKERLILIILGLIYMNYMIYFLYIITFFSLVTCLQRFYRNYKTLIELKKEG